MNDEYDNAQTDREMMEAIRAREQDIRDGGEGLTRTRQLFDPTDYGTQPAHVFIPDDQDKFAHIEEELHSIHRKLDASPAVQNPPEQEFEYESAQQRLFVIALGVLLGITGAFVLFAIFLTAWVTFQ